MKSKTIQTIVVTTLALGVVLSLLAWTQSPTSSEPRLITVTGDADVRVVPDEVILTLGVETWDKDMAVAKSQNDQIVSAVLDLATDYGVPTNRIQTDYVNIEPRYRDGYYEARDFIGFFVQKSVVITLRDLSQFEDLLASVLDAGVNYVLGIEFRTTELRQHRDEARALAIGAAREKAEALAGELDQEIGEPVNIQENQSGWWSSYGAWWGARWGSGMAQNVIQEVGGSTFAGDSNVAPGQISVRAQVSVTFALADGG